LTNAAKADTVHSFFDRTHQVGPNELLPHFI
jgi:hypothetical protein